MAKHLTVGILAETKNDWERRAPLTPEDVQWLTERKVAIEVETSDIRAFTDTAYRDAGAKIVKKLQKARFVLGIKEPQKDKLIPGAIYLVFSHVTKGQKANRPLLNEFIKRKNTLLDYEHITDPQGNRLVYFGEYAGICGMIDCLHYLGQDLSLKGFSTPLAKIKHSLTYKRFDKAARALKRVGSEIKEDGLHHKLAPFLIAITGHGHAAGGVCKVLDLLSAEDVHPKDIRSFIRKNKDETHKLFKMVITREEKFRAKDGEGYYFEEYLRHPDRFESNLDQYLDSITVLMHCSYWDKRFPRLVTKDMLSRISQKKSFRLRMIGDISCDAHGGIEITDKVMSPLDPLPYYDPKTKVYTEGLGSKGIALLAVDHLPCEFPEEASQEFSDQICDYVYQIASHGASDISNHHALPAELRRAIVCEAGSLMEKFSYLKKHLN